MPKLFLYVKIVVLNKLVLAWRYAFDADDPIVSYSAFGDGELYYAVL